MKRKSLTYEILTTALVLVVIAGIAGALLGLVNHFTKVDAEELTYRKAAAVYDGELTGRPIQEGIGQAIEYQGGRVVGVYVPKDPSVTDVFVLCAEGSGAYKGTLKVLVNITGGKIVSMAKYEADETPGLGSKALVDSYFKQYYGVTITPSFEGFKVVKSAPLSGSEVKAVSGASKSSTAVTNAVNAAIKWYQTVVLIGGAK